MKYKFEIQDFRKWSFEYNEKKLETIEWNKLIKKDGKYLQPHDYQIEAIKQCLLEKTGVVQAPTGGGKTVAFAMLTKITAIPTLILFDSKSLVHKTYKNFLEFGFDEKDLGIIQAENYKPGRITFATIQSKEKYTHLLRAFEMVIIDECHAVKANQFKELFLDVSASHRFGFSATPYDEYNPAHFGKTIEYIGRIIYNEKTTRQLVDDGYLAKDEFIFVKCDRSKDNEVIYIRGGGNNYPLLYRNEIVANEYRNSLIAMICKKHSNERILILFESIAHEHGERIAEEIRKLEPDRDVKILHGENSENERQAAIKFFEENSGGIIIASRIFNKGIDIPSVHVGINAAAGKSFIQVIQKAGRVLRKGNDKSSMIYYDFMDLNSKIFLEQSRRRKKIYKDKEMNVKVVSPKDIGI